MWLVKGLITNFIAYVLMGLRIKSIKEMQKEYITKEKHDRIRPNFSINCQLTIIFIVNLNEKMSYLRHLFQTII